MADVDHCVELPLRSAETPESWFHRRATHYVEAQILFHLNQSGVLRRLSLGTPCSAEELAGALDLDGSVVDVLLDYIFGVDDLLERDDDHRYSLSPFGERVLARFSDGAGDAGDRAINMFDVRVGAYGPVWNNLGRMLSGEARYGEDFRRGGEFAEKGVTKLARHFAATLSEVIYRTGAKTVLEVGTTTGLLARLIEARPDLALFGLDRSARALAETEQMLGEGGADVGLLQADFFDVSDWVEAIEDAPAGLIYSLHFHEMIAAGQERLVTTLRILRQRLAGWAVVALEQPRLPQAERAALQETLWLYGQSNILIHHLIGNGRILSREQWIAIGEDAGCPAVTEVACGYLGYRAFVFQL